MHTEVKGEGPCKSCGKALMKPTRIGPWCLESMHIPCWKRTEAEKAKEEEVMLRRMLAHHEAAMSRTDYGPETILEYIQAQPQREAFVKWLRKKRNASFDVVADMIEAGPNFNAEEKKYLSEFKNKFKQ